ELPVLPELHHEVPRLASLLRASRTKLVERLLEPLDLGVRLLDGPLERAVELVEDLNPPELPLRDVVELLLHLRGEGRVDDVGEELDQEVGYDLAHVLRKEPTRLEPDVPALLHRL